MSLISDTSKTVVQAQQIVTEGVTAENINVNDTLTVNNESVNYLGVNNSALFAGLVDVQGAFKAEGGILLDATNTTLNHIKGLQGYASQAAATTAGLVNGDMYWINNAADPNYKHVMIVQ